MNALILSYMLAALASTTFSATIPTEETEKQPTESNVETFDSYAVQSLPSQLPLAIQLPNPEPAIPFYPSLPPSYLKAPEFIASPIPNFYQVPIPSDILTAPREEPWNPSNDPTLYYELPASITKEELPTRTFPKKFSQDIHIKNKPLASAPKKEIILEPVNESQYNQKQKDLYKAVDKLNKQDNKMEIEQEKKKQAVQI